MGGSLYAGKAILFDDVIDNITMDGEYYAKCSLTFTVGETEELYKKLDEGGGWYKHVGRDVEIFYGELE